MQAMNSTDIAGDFVVGIAAGTEGPRISLPAQPAVSDWEREVDSFLAELSTVQEQVLTMLARKRQALIAGDHTELATIGEEEQQILTRLADCHRRRAELLEHAGGHGLPSDSIQSLASALPAASRQELKAKVAHATARTQLLRHQSLTNWLLVQRTLVHLAQTIEIIATGGRTRPTYGSGAPAGENGSLLDQAG